MILSQSERIRRESDGRGSLILKIPPFVCASSILVSALITMPIVSPSPIRSSLLSRGTETDLFGIPRRRVVGGAGVD